MGLTPAPIPPETRAHLTAPPAPRWCADLLADPSLQPVRASSRVKRPSTTSCALIGETLNTENTFRAWQCFYRAGAGASSGRKNENENGNNSTTPPPDADAADELLILFSLGTGMDGHAGVLHGGILAVMFDELLGTLATTAIPQPQDKEDVSGDWTPIYTVSLTIRFRRPLTTPGFVLGRAWCDDAGRRRTSYGRKVWVRGVLEDGEGGEVFAEGEAVYVEMKKREKKKTDNNDKRGMARL
ncbi:hypothetical protein VTN02DRAFT_1161 [Thermoascus thermophilus]